MYFVCYNTLLPLAVLDKLPVHGYSLVAMSDSCFRGYQSQWHCCMISSSLLFSTNHDYSLWLWMWHPSLILVHFWLLRDTFCCSVTLSSLWTIGEFCTCVFFSSLCWCWAFIFWSKQWPTHGILSLFACNTLLYLISLLPSLVAITLRQFDFDQVFWTSATAQHCNNLLMSFLCARQGAMVFQQCWYMFWMKMER